MKKSSSDARKNGNRSNANSRTSSSTVRRAAPAPELNPYIYGKDAVKKASKKKASKNKRATVFAVVASIAAICILFIALWCNGVFSRKIKISMPDGSVKSVSVDAIKKALAGDTYYDGILIDGIPVGGMTKEEATEKVSQDEPEVPVSVDMALSLGGTVYPLDLSSLPLENDMAQIIDEAYMYARPSENPTDEELADCYSKYLALKEQNKQYVTAYTVETDGLSEIVHSVLDPLNKEAANAQVSGFDITSLEFSITPEQVGYQIDIDGAIAAVKDSLDNGVYMATIEVAAETQQPTVTASSLTEGYGMITESSSHTTSSNSRNHNIRITCEKLDGLVIQPGESFSFNDFIGERTAEAGYEMAGTIQNGQVADDYGGGICQVSSMIYQCVVKSNLQVDERHPHMWPSSYAAAGTDAAVDWGSEDFCFTNNSETPVALHAFYDNDDLSITVQMYGKLFEDGQYIGFEGQIVSTTPSTEVVYVANPTLPVGQTNQVRASHDGVVARSYQVWYDASGTEISRTEYGTSNYSLIKKKVEVGILNPDGTLATMDETTGVVLTPTPTPAPTPVPVETTPGNTSASITPPTP